MLDTVLQSSFLTSKNPEDLIYLAEEYQDEPLSFQCFITDVCVERIAVLLFGLGSTWTL